MSQANKKAWEEKWFDGIVRSSHRELVTLRERYNTKDQRGSGENREVNKIYDVRDAAKKRTWRHGGFVRTETQIRDLRDIYRTMATSAVKVANNCSPMTYVNDIDHTHATII